MERVFLLQHENPATEDVKVIGIYRTQAAAEAAIERLAGQLGFRDASVGFHIDSYKLDADHWTEGFGLD